jgi:hypothetical protein
VIEKLKELKTRTELLSYNDKKELDDIQRKTKLYLERMFPQKFTYPGEVDRISFLPTYYLSGMGNQPYYDSWKQGKEELINLLDTRIEEAKLVISKTKPETENIKVVEKVIQVEDYRRINELTQELNAVKANKSLWGRINYFALVSVILSLLGGAFFLGKYFGENRFDQEKTDLLFENKDLKNRTDSLSNELEKQKPQILKAIDIKR